MFYFLALTGELAFFSLSCILARFLSFSGILGSLKRGFSNGGYILPRSSTDSYKTCGTFYLDGVFYLLERICAFIWRAHWKDKHLGIGFCYMAF